jgi:para-nitrobenzyl esterase
MVNTHQRYHARGKAAGFVQELFVGLLVVCAATAVSAVSAIADSKVVMTDDGPVKGMVVHGVREFLGIPYAAPPVGDLRWQPSQAHAPWVQPLDATKFANHCPQVASPFGVASLTEDCLYLNVFTRHTGDDHDDREASRRRPVMVWIHGGSLVVGESDDYDPTQLVKEGGVIVVTINYRLGLLGFFAEPALDAEPHLLANYGLMDQQFALQWVRRNIAAFGGDPDRVTIFGESAGGLSAFSNLASPKAAGLFQRAIVESGAYQITSPLPTLAQGETAGSAVATALGCTSGSNAAIAACLRSESVADILGAQGSSAVPIVDGQVLTEQLASAFGSGNFNQVPVIDGSNHDEWRLFVALDFDLLGSPLTAAGYPAALAATFGTALEPAVILQYPLSNYLSPDEAFAASVTDPVFSCPARLADQLMSPFVRTFAYEFNDENAPEVFLPPVSFPYGAAHGSEIQYLFKITESFPATLTPDQEKLSDAMIRYWTRFAATGDPNSFRTPVWPRYSSLTDKFQSLMPRTPSTETNFATDHHCSFWIP